MLQGSWRTILLFVNGTAVGETDPQFDLDYGFYAFKLPIFQMIVSTLSMLTIVALIIALVGHCVLGGIRIGNQAAGVKGSLSKPARVQLAVTAGIWMLLKDRKSTRLNSSHVAISYAVF